MHACHAPQFYEWMMAADRVKDTHLTHVNYAVFGLLRPMWSVYCMRSGVICASD